MSMDPVALDIDREALMTVVEPPSPAPMRRSKGLVRRALLVGGGFAVLAGASYYGWDYWAVGRFQVSTDDAYVQADSTTIAPKISGYLSAVPVADNERVRSGQLLARIDGRDFTTAVSQAKADVDAARATVAGKQAALQMQQSIIEGARATIAVDAANHSFALQEDQRYVALAATGFGTMQNAQRAVARTAATRSSISRDTAAFSAAIGQVDVLKAELAQAQATFEHSQAAERQADLNLSYTSITAAIDGVVGNRTLRVGQYVQAGTQLMAVVPISQAYIVANYKETQLTEVRPGQAVEITVDMFPGVVAYGHVDSLAPASGQEFALLPPDNATGNFTKIVQRIPVKIVLDPGSPLIGKLRPGMSVYPTIETRASPRVTTTASRAG